MTDLPPRRPAFGDARAGLIALGVVLLAGLVTGLAQAMGQGYRGYLAWRTIAGAVRTATPWALTAALLVTFQHLLLAWALRFRRRVATVLISVWLLAAAVAALLPALIRRAAERMPVERLPVFARDPESMAAFLRKIAGALLMPDRLWQTMRDRPTLAVLLGLLPLLLGALAYAVLHWPLRRWSAHVSLRAVAWKRWAPALIAVVILAGAPSLIARLSRPPTNGRPDLIFVSIDTLRLDAVGAYGATPSVTPHLDALAASGARVTGMRAPSSWTLPSHASMLTGRWPWALGIRRVADALAPSTTTLAEHLAAQGYDTFAVVTHLFVDAPYGFGQGFERIMHPGSELARDAVGLATRWLAKRGDAPAFLFVHLYDPHWPYNPPADVPEWIFAGTSEEDRQEVNRYTDAFDLAMALAVGPPALTEAAKALYRGEIWSADHALGDLFALVRQRGRPAYVVVVSDHGELFGEHDMRGHGITLFEGEVRVPCLVAGPEIPPGLPVAGNANLIDLAPALLDLMRLSPLPHTREPGLAAALRGGPTPPPRWLGGENHSISTLPIRYVTDGVWKWFSGMDQQVRTAYLRYAEAAYRVDSDPDEAVNRLADSGVPGFREIAGALFGGAATSERHVTLDPAERERLRALGYLP